MTTKISLDATALKAAIGGDSEVELELRNAIVQEFTKKHLKPLASEAYVQQAKAEIIRAIQKEITAILPLKEVRERYTSAWVLDESTPLGKEMKDEIEKIVTRSIREQFNQAIEQYANKLLQNDLEKRLLTKVEEYLGRVITSKIEQMVVKVVGERVATLKVKTQIQIDNE